MPMLTVTARGQVTFRKEVLDHMGIAPGEKVEVDLLPEGRVVLKAAKRTGKMEDLFGFFAHDTNEKATIEEINEAIAAGWSGLVK